MGHIVHESEFSLVGIVKKAKSFTSLVAHGAGAYLPFL